MVSVCPGGKVLLTCERTSGSFMQWTVSVPHLAIPLESIVTSQAILPPEFKIGYTELNITHTSQRPLTSQMLINNVTTEINGSTIYCLDEVGNENDAPMVVINMIHKGMIIRFTVCISFYIMLILRQCLAKCRFSPCFFGKSLLDK